MVKTDTSRPAHEKQAITGCSLGHACVVRGAFAWFSEIRDSNGSCRIVRLPAYRYALRSEPAFAHRRACVANHRFAISLVLLGRGKEVHLALSTLIWATWAIASTVLFFFGGVRGTLVVIFPLIIMLGGWLLGTRQAVMLALVTTATTLTLMLTENAQKPHPRRK